MAHRCRSCGFVHVLPTAAIHFPWPDRLARIDPVLESLLEAAREFESFGPGTPVEFVTWLSVETRRAAQVVGTRGGLTARIK